MGTAYIHLTGRHLLVGGSTTADFTRLQTLQKESVFCKRVLAFFVGTTLFYSVAVEAGLQFISISE